MSYTSRPILKNNSGHYYLSDTSAYLGIGTTDPGSRVQINEGLTQLEIDLSITPTYRSPKGFKIDPGDQEGYYQYNSVDVEIWRTDGACAPKVHKGYDLGVATKSYDDINADDFWNRTHYTELEPVEALSTICNIKKRPILDESLNIKYIPDYDTLPEFVRGYKKKKINITDERPNGEISGNFWKNGNIVPMLNGEPIIENSEWIPDYTDELDNAISVNRLQTIIIEALKEINERIKSIETIVFS